MVDAFLYATHYNYDSPASYTIFTPVADSDTDYVAKGMTEANLTGLVRQDRDEAFRQLGQGPIPSDGARGGGE